MPFIFSYVPTVTDKDYPAGDEALSFVERLEAAGPIPEVPPPCWDSRPIDAEACAAATRAMCA